MILLTELSNTIQVDLPLIETHTEVLQCFTQAALYEAGRGSSPDSGSAGAFIVDIQPPELGGIHFCHLTTQSVVTYYSSRVD